MVVIRVPMELLTEVKMLEYEMHFEVAKRAIDVVEVFNGVTGEKIGPANF